MDNTSDTHEALATLRKEADELLIKRHIIEVYTYFDLTLKDLQTYLGLKKVIQSSLTRLSNKNIL